MGTDYELQTIINAVVAKHTKALEEEMQSVMTTFYRAKREELSKMVEGARKHAYNDCYKWHAENGFISLEDFSKTSMMEIAEKISEYTEG